MGENGCGQSERARERRQISAYTHSKSQPLAPSIAARALTVQELRGNLVVRMRATVQRRSRIREHFIVTNVVVIDLIHARIGRGRRQCW